MMRVQTDTTLDVYLLPEDLKAQLRRDAFVGLSADVKSVPSKWFYDEQGSQLFDEITRLPEYYLTRAEREILDARCDQIAMLAGASTLVELGSGTSEKTRLLLQAMRRTGLENFMPFDVDEATLRRAASNIKMEFPGVAVHGIVGDFEHHLKHIPAEGRRLVAFLGSTIGNLLPDERARFLTEVGQVLQPDEWLLLGIDLVKDPAVISAAYNDSASLSARFNLNMLNVVNAACGADFEPARFTHVAEWDPVNEWMSMSLRSDLAQTVILTDPALEVRFDEGELLHTEISAKFHVDGMSAELARAGLVVQESWTDLQGRFALLLAQRT